MRGAVCSSRFDVQDVEHLINYSIQESDHADRDLSLCAVWTRAWLQGPCLRVRKSPRARLLDRIFRLMRLTRLARMLRSMPELMILIKARIARAQAP